MPSSKPLTLASIWPRPNFRQAALDGVPVDVSILYMVVYDNLRRTAVDWAAGQPAMSITFWQEQYRRGIEFFKLAWQNRTYTTMGALSRGFIRYMHAGLSSNESRYSTAAVAKGRVMPDGTPTDLPRYLQMRRRSLGAMGWPADMGIPDDAKVGVVKVNPGSGPRGYEAGFYPSLALLGTNRLVPLRHTPYASKRAAIRSAISEQKELNERNLVRGGTPTLEYHRVGVDWRQGGEVSDAVLLSIFGFKGLEFGKTITPSEKTGFVYALFDACMDLCNVLEASSPAASCFGRLGIAFGSQGRGASTGAATFDADSWQMHLTRTRGGGALCHEFGHALDAMMFDALVDRQKAPDGAQYISDIIAMHYDESGRYGIVTGVLPMMKSPMLTKGLLQRLEDLFENLFSRLRSDSLFNRSEEMDNKQGRGIYWSSPRELFARAFETFALDKLKSIGIFNDFLVRHVDSFKREGVGYECSIFPQGFQRIELAQQFAKLNDELRDVDLHP